MACCRDARVLWPADHLTHHLSAVVHAMLESTKNHPSGFYATSRAINSKISHSSANGKAVARFS